MAKQNKTKVDGFIELKNTQKFEPIRATTTYIDKLKHIIKLNEELTAENSRLLTELDGITSDKDMAEHNYNLACERLHYLHEKNKVLIDVNKDLERNLKSELTSIKSKWWYKLITGKW